MRVLEYVGILAASIGCLCSCVSLPAGHDASPDTDLIATTGVLAKEKRKDGGIEFKRFPDYILALYPAGKIRRNGKDRGFMVAGRKGRTTACVKLYFKTASKNIDMVFKIPDGYQNRGCDFRIYQNGKVWKDVKFPAKDKGGTLHIVSEHPGDSVLYTIAMPSWADPILYKMTLDDGAKLEPCQPPKRKLYVAYGDSVSHGTGQGSASYKTWPYILADLLGYDIHNLAIGGASIKPDFMEVFKEFKRIDLITIYIGINDAGNKTPAEFKKAYREMLETIRKYHPDTKIFCISIHSVPEDKRGRRGKLVDYRQPVVDAVGERRATGDKNIYLVDGRKLVDIEDAMSPGNVHLSPEGAAKWARNLYKIVKPVLDGDGK